MTTQIKDQFSILAFTFIDLLFTITIIAILAAILFPVFARAHENARRSFWATADAMRKATFQIQAASSVQPFVASKSALARDIEFSTPWQKYSFVLNESYDFFTQTQP